jgi:hypothetical protein
MRNEVTCVRIVSSSEKLFYKRYPGSYFFIMKMNINLKLLIKSFWKITFQFFDPHKRETKSSQEKRKEQTSISKFVKETFHLKCCTIAAPTTLAMSSDEPKRVFVCSPRLLHVTRKEIPP